jgi:hypothetical protein
MNKPELIEGIKQLAHKKGEPFPFTHPSSTTQGKLEKGMFPKNLKKELI